MPPEIIYENDWNTELRVQAYAVMDAAESAMGALRDQAYELRAAFRARRESLRILAQAEADARTPVGKRSKLVYAPLNLFCRVRGAGLELTWQEVHTNPVTHTRRFKYLRLAAEGNADLRLVLSRALVFERDLIRETEAHARHIRAQWKLWLRIRADAERVLELAECGPSRIAPPVGSTSKENAEPDHVLHDWVPAVE